MQHSIGEDRIHRLVALANSAGLDQRIWQWFLEDLSRAAGGINVHFLTHDTRVETGLGHVGSGYDPRYVESFETYYSTRNVFAPAISRMQIGKVHSVGELISEDQLRKSEFFTDWLRPQGYLTGGAAAILTQSGSRATLIGGTIRDADRAQLEAPFVALLEQLVPTIQHAFQVSNTIGRLNLENRILREGLEPEVTALIALDSQGRVHYANRRGDKMIAAGQTMRQDTSGRLVFQDVTARKALGCALQDHFQAEPGYSLPFFTPDGGRRQMICRTLLVRDTDGPLPWLAATGNAQDGFVLLLLAPVVPDTGYHHNEAAAC